MAHAPIQAEPRIGNAGRRLAEERRRPYIALSLLQMPPERCIMTRDGADRRADEFQPNRQAAS